MRIAEAKAGKPATVYHFAGSLGHPVVTQDEVEDLDFVQVGRRDITVVRVTEGEDGRPRVVASGVTPHGLTYNGSPPASPQKGIEVRTASGDRNPKNLVLQSGTSGSPTRWTATVARRSSGIRSRPRGASCRRGCSAASGPATSRRRSR
jgi:hypothetical protein